MVVVVVIAFFLGFLFSNFSWVSLPSLWPKVNWIGLRFFLWGRPPHPIWWQVTVDQCGSTHLDRSSHIWSIRMKNWSPSWIYKSSVHWAHTNSHFYDINTCATHLYTSFVQNMLSIRWLRALRLFVYYFIVWNLIRMGFDRINSDS